MQILQCAFGVNICLVTKDQSLYRKELLQLYSLRA